MPYSFSLRVYYEDTDAGGVVYYANYLKFAERARTEMLRGAGIEQAALMEEHGIAFVVRSVKAEFFRPARLDDLLTIDTILQDIGKASLAMQQIIRLHSLPLVQLDLRIGAVGKNLRPARMPEFLSCALAALITP